MRINVRHRVFDIPRTLKPIWLIILLRKRCYSEQKNLLYNQRFFSWTFHTKLKYSNGNGTLFLCSFSFKLRWTFSKQSFFLCSKLYFLLSLEELLDDDASIKSKIKIISNWCTYVYTYRSLHWSNNLSVKI